ncbi:MAG: clostripain-related cysteine peptidase [candidate division WOR-3 bacterium]|nr:clostripain-related cysteine peptidase [candidate division WOR-3 bacterium]
MKSLCFFLLIPLALFAQDWTMLVYVAADNDLAQWADSDLVEMELIGSNQNVSVVAQIDKPYIGAKRMLVNQGSSYVIQELGVIDMCAWETLYDFLAWGISSFPADRYLVILWDHGSGWSAMPNRSFGADWSSGNVLSIANGDFEKALDNAYQYTGERIDLFAFDACLMQQIEVAFELKDFAHILLAPQSIMPLPGFRYDEVIQIIHADPGINAADLSRGIAQSTVSNYQNIQPIAIASVNLLRLNEIQNDFVNLASVLMYESPGAALRAVRQNVQTIPSIGCTPDTSDDFIDLGDFILGLDNIYTGGEIDRLIDSYDLAVAYTSYWGEAFAQTTGMTIWFPDVYRQFKQQFYDYDNLEWSRSNWLRFLNWYYDSDDIRPTRPSLEATAPGNDNEFTLSWAGSYDLAPLKYDVFEMSRLMPVFSDPCEDSSQWNFSGFALTSLNHYTGSYSFFSGNTGNLNNYIETKDNIEIEGIGMMHLYLHHNTEDMTDSLIIQYGPFQDVHYGYSGGWIQRTILLPPGDYPIRIFYRTNSVNNLGGCYIDDIQLYILTDARTAGNDLDETHLRLFNVPRGVHQYLVYAEDSYGNTSNLSNILEVDIEQYAAPYSIPNPFQTSCYIALDYPDTLNPTVELFSLRGARVKKFYPNQIVDKKIFWDGKDEDSRDIAAGVYFILVKDAGFKKIGKIARQR